MKVTNKILSIPPYISTTWSHVDHLKVEGKTLIICLTNGTNVTIPDMDEASIQHIFTCHADSVDETPPVGIELANLPMDIGSLMGHNPAQSDAPNFPSDITSKIAGLIKALGLDLHIFQIPEEASDCNCPYCQIAKSLHSPVPVEEPITEEDLRFKDWDVKQTNEKLFEVTHPLDAQEHYQVFLGNPIGCTCGKTDCEHIRAVLLTS